MINNKNLIHKFKKASFITYNEKYFCSVGRSHVAIYDLDTYKIVAKFNDIKHLNYAKFTTDDRLIVKNTKGYYFLYNLNSLSLEKKFSPPKNVIGSITNFEITHDNKYIIDFSYVYPTYELVVMNIETGEYNHFNIGHPRSSIVLSTEETSKFYIIASCAEPVDFPETNREVFYLLTYTTKGFNLEKCFTNDISRVFNTCYGTGKFLYKNVGNKISILDFKSKNIENFEYEQDGVLYDLKLSKNGKMCVLVESNNVYVFDLKTKRCIKTFDVDYGCFAAFFDNDTKLLIGTWNEGYCVSLDN